MNISTKNIITKINKNKKLHSKCWNTNASKLEGKYNQFHIIFITCIKRYENPRVPQFEQNLVFCESSNPHTFPSGSMPLHTLTFGTSTTTFCLLKIKGSTGCRHFGQELDFLVRFSPHGQPSTMAGQKAESNSSSASILKELQKLPMHKNMGIAYVCTR